MLTQTELDNQLVIHVFGETDFTSFAIDKSAFDTSAEPVFDTPAGEDYVQVLGTLFGGGNWQSLKDRVAENGLRYEELVARSIVSLVAGTETLRAALERGYNLIAIGVFRAPDRDGAAGFTARFLGTSLTSTADPHAHLELVKEGSRAMAPFLQEDIDAGRLSAKSVVARLISEGDEVETDGEGAPGDEDDWEGEAGLQTATFFHEMVTEKGLESVIICACDPDIAEAAAGVDRLNVGLVSGIIPTPFGSVGYWLWQVAPDSEAGFLQEQFIDLSEFPDPTYDRMKRAEMVRFLVVDRSTQENTRGVFLGTESLGLAGFEEMAREVSASESGVDFEAACAHVLETVEPRDFLDRAQAQEASGKTNLH
ncbi:hypothetical protein LR948_14830 [Roseivivax sp. GX 12232]|uniref:hypothetical protein n=1 Tax=Roseivivax sp. GX 12232 TaxID=2900547 RepID=UPI001E5D76CB|nr:hypothetical protein [Roseivivax sp. GX 12232]MCE0506642.1 hypothetical protein [Roseivivax sp. GX 12232]